MILTLAAIFFGVALLNVLFWPRVSRRGEPRLGALSVLIPARDEEQNLAACLNSVLEQGASIAEVLVYDDHSLDGTALIIEQYSQRDARVRLVHPLPLPAEWCGKNFACAQLASQASAHWLLFIDADARLLPRAVDRLLEEAVSRRLTFLSAWPGFDLIGFWEGALMPLLNFVVFTLFPAPLSLIRQDESLGLAHGACVLADRAAYERLGGHSSVRNEIFEDTRLAQWWRANGEPGLCLDGQDIIRVRMYASFEEIWSGFQKNFFPAFRKQISFWAFLVLHFAVFLLPFIVLDWRPIGFVIATRALLAFRFRQSWWRVFTHPVGELILLALGVSSWWACRSGRGVAWKGRQYRASRV